MRIWLEHYSNTVEKLRLDWSNIDDYVYAIAHTMVMEGWTPDYIVGLTRGGCTPAVMLSHKLNVPCTMLNVQLRDGHTETNCWMSEDAVRENKKILVVDDINDTGATFDWIKNDWQLSCAPSNNPKWPEIWHKAVKFAALIHNEGSVAKSDYVGLTIDKRVNPCWVCFPWEKNDN
jgi:hypoxanthine phosphoribosyltransferase